MAMATPPTQCPCGLSYEAVYQASLANNFICPAPDADGNACGKRLADHPREAQFTSTQAQGK
jgi:hypothetical protein